MCATEATGPGNNLLDKIKQELDLEPGNPALHRRLAAACYLYGHTEEAIEHLRLAVELSDHEPDYVLSLAEALLDAGYPEEALPLFERAAAQLQEGALRRARTGLAAAALEAPVIQKMLKLEETTPAPSKYLVSATLLLLRGKRRDAVNEYTKALDADETALLAAENVAFLWSVERDMGGPEVRIRDLLKAAKSTEHSYRMDLYLADAYANSGIFENAVKHLAASLHAEPRYLPAYTQAATLLRQMELRESAGSETLRAAVDASLKVLETQTPSLALLARGRTSRRAAGSIPARCVEEALEADDAFVRLMGTVEAADSLPAEQAEKLTADADLGESHLAGLVRARLLLETKGVQEAADEAERTLDKHPHRAEAAHAVTYFWGLGRRLGTAQAMLEAAGDVEGMEPERFLEIGMTLIEAGRAADALRLCEGLASPQAAVVKARVLSRKGDNEAALALLEETAAGLQDPPRELRRELARLNFVLGRDKTAIDFLTDDE